MRRSSPFRLLPLSPSGRSGPFAQTSDRLGYSPSPISRRSLGPMAERVQGSFSTPDGLWRVEVYRARGQSWFRLWHLDRIYQDRLVIGTVEYFLSLNGVDWADLIEDQPEP